MNTDNPPPLPATFPPNFPPAAVATPALTGPGSSDQKPMARPLASFSLLLSLANIRPAMITPHQSLVRNTTKRHPASCMAVQFLLTVALTLAFGVSPVAAQMIPENDYAELKKRITKSSKDTSAIRSWFERNLKPMDDSPHMFTPEYLRFLQDVGLLNWDGSVTEQQLRRKWGKRFDVDRRVPDHAFETGNCGWGTQKLTKFEYLGQLNGGDWFRLTIKGGCGENDYSETVTRVIKVISSKGQYQIANMVAL